MANQLTTSQVAERLNISAAHVRKIANKHAVGDRLSPRVLVFDERDLTILRGYLVPGRGRKKTERPETADAD